MEFVEINDRSTLNALPEETRVIDSEGAIFIRTDRGWQDCMDRAWETSRCCPLIS
jgi:hypothetical protein